MEARRQDTRIDAEHVLKYALYRQIERVERLVELGEKLPFLTPKGYEEIEAFVQIGDSIRKIEVGEQLMRGKNGNMPFAKLRPEASIEAPSDLEEGMGQFGEINLDQFREAGNRVAEMVRGVVGGRFSIGGLDAGSEAAGAAKKADHPKAAVSDFANKKQR